MNAAESQKLGMEDKTHTTLESEDNFMITGEPLYGGQGKNNKSNNVMSNTCLPLGKTDHKKTNQIGKG
jgi:hypothetical protein